MPRFYFVWVMIELMSDTEKKCRVKTVAKTKDAAKKIALVVGLMFEL